MTSPGTSRPSCLCASLAVPRQTTLPGPASCCTNKLFSRELLETPFKKLSRHLHSCSHGSPGTSSMHCLCALVGPGHAEAQADELPMHLIAGALATAICALTSPGTGRPSCLCASLAVPRQTTLPGPASRCNNKVLLLESLEKTFRRPSRQLHSCSHGSPGTSSMHCLCALVGPGHAEAQADELPMHLIAGALAKAIFALASPGPGIPCCLCATLAVPKQTTLPGPTSCCNNKVFLPESSRRNSKGPFANFMLVLMAAQAQAACTAYVP